MTTIRADLSKTQLGTIHIKLLRGFGLRVWLGTKLIRAGCAMFPVGLNCEIEP